MKLRNVLMAASLIAIAPLASHAQTKVTRIGGTAPARFSTAIWAGDTLYISGQMASPAMAPDPAKKMPAMYGDTKQQTVSVLTKIQDILKSQGLTMGDVVEMQVFLAPVPATGKMDFAGMNEAYGQFFGTTDQPNKPVRAAMQVAALATDWGLVEIQVIAVKSK
jgi:enamine deaminase RidA (YjgF/YER057c/UK114 family)